MKRIGITGGIGSGKSVVCRFLHMSGYSVYDSDRQAKMLMDTSPQIKAGLVAEFGSEMYDAGGHLDRSRLAGRVFTDDAALKRLNAIVHPAVKADFEKWCRSRADESAVFMESAILVEAHFADAVDEIWLVTAPEETRMARIMARNGCSREEAVSRIRAQMPDVEKEKFSSRIITNSDEKPIIPQILSALATL